MKINTILMSILICLILIITGCTQQTKYVCSDGTEISDSYFCPENSYDVPESDSGNTASSGGLSYTVKPVNSQCDISKAFTCSQSGEYLISCSGGQMRCNMGCMIYNDKYGNKNAKCDK